MMNSAYKLNKHSNNIQPWRTPFPIWNQAVFPCPVLAVASWPAYRFRRRQLRWCSIPISLRIFQFFVFFFLSSTQKNHLLHRNTSVQSGSSWPFTMVKEVLCSFYCIWKLPIQPHTPGCLLLLSFSFQWSPFPVSSLPSQLSHLTTSNLHLPISNMPYSNPWQWLKACQRPYAEDKHWILLKTRKHPPGTRITGL